MLSTLLQCCIVIVMQIKLTVVVVVVVDSRRKFLHFSFFLCGIRLIMQSLMKPLCNSQRKSCFE